MKLFVIVEDNAGQLFTFALNDVSFKHATNKAKKHTESKFKATVKRVRVFKDIENACIPYRLNKHNFPLVKAN